LAEESAGSVRSREGFVDPNTLSIAQETAWVTASQQGDSLAFNRLVLKWEKSIYNVALRMLQDPEEAAEVTQEVFLAAYKNIRRFRHDAKFSTWLYRIGVNQCITRLRRRPPGLHYSLDDRDSSFEVAGRMQPVESHEAEVLRDESKTHVRRALESLSLEQKAVVELKFFQELTFEQIASVVQVPLSTVKSRLYAGLETLKSRLGYLGPSTRMEV
jgi:RNA polymerase sigma-70 factor (ECF subfamily)